MGKIVVTNHVTLDGVMQAPGRADEDVRGGFEHGGWAVSRSDAVMGEVLGASMAAGGPLLLGRVTYESFYEFWPKQADNPFTAVLDNASKYVVSTTLGEPLPWRNSILIDDAVPARVADLRAQIEEPISVLGSGELCESLRAHHLIDEYVLMIHPILLGAGRRLFPAAGSQSELELTDCVTTSTGVMIATYRA